MNILFSSFNPLRRAFKVFFAVVIFSYICAALAIQTSSAAEQAETANLLTKTEPVPEISEKDQFYYNNFFEISDVRQGSRKGHWSEFTNTVGYMHKNLNVYGFLSRFERFKEKDYTSGAGAYAIFKDSYLHAESSFGWDINYIYKFKGTAEYEHRLYKTLYARIEYEYRHYSINDSHNLLPGATYYFGNSYISASYGAGFIEHRDTAHFGLIKSSLALTDSLHISSGAAFGQRLFDIYGLNAAKEKGYVFFTGLDYEFYKGITARIGVSYSEEEPSFIKRSINCGISLKF